MPSIEKGLAEGMEKGLAEGMEKGMNQRSQEIAPIGMPHSKPFLNTVGATYVHVVEDRVLQAFRDVVFS